MPKPVCVKCRLFYRPKRNGVAWEEGMPGPGPIHNEDGWTSYKLWRADLWECRGCGNEIIVGHADRPFAEHYQEHYAQNREGVKPYVFVKDC